MTDRRELILQRLLKIMEGIPGIRTIKRNVDMMPEDVRPCLILIDGDEQRADGALGYGMRPVVMTMSPMISLGVSAVSEDVGAEINAFRAKLIPAILGDSTLVNELTSNGKVAYDGLLGRLSSGNLMASDMQLNFAITYPLHPASM